MTKIRNLFRQFGLFIPKDSISLYWWPGENNRNFGDVISLYLVEKISNKKPIWCNAKWCLKEYYTVTGSILKLVNKNALIWGSGIISINDKIKKPKKIFAVRGPITRKRLLELGLNCPEIYGDPALLLPRFYKPQAEKKYEVGIIPHYTDYDKIKKMIKSKRVLIINLLDPIEKVIDDICSCNKTVSSSLHGIITSHAYGIPSVWVKFSDNLAGDGTKFRDYFLSVGIEPYKVFNFKNKIPKIKKLIRIVNEKKNEKPQINTDRLLEVCPFKN